MALSKKRRNELKYICLAYPEKVKQIQEFSYIQSPTFEGVGGSRKNDTLERKVIKNLELKRQIEIIEQTCIKVFGGDDYQEAMKNITQGVPWEFLEVYMSRRSFYRKRTKFFNELDEIL